MTREIDRQDAMVALRDKIDRALGDDGQDPLVNRDQERILRSVVRKTIALAAQKPGAGRRCGDCQLCCKLTPIKEMNKPANQRCQHQRVGKGCMIYSQRPFSCQAWNCRWLLNDDTADLRRPDHAHYVIDVMPDYITARNNQTGEEQHCPVLQIWVDPKFPDAHRDPALRAYLLRRGEEGIASIIRFNEADGFVLFPPNMASDGQWHEQRGQSVDRGDDESHMARMARVLGGHVEMAFEEKG